MGFFFKFGPSINNVGSFEGGEGPRTRPGLLSLSWEVYAFLSSARVTRSPTGRSLLVSDPLFFFLSLGPFIYYVSTKGGRGVELSSSSWEVHASPSSARVTRSPMIGRRKNWKVIVGKWGLFSLFFSLFFLQL